MKANRIKWNPSMLNKFLLPDYNINHKVKYTHAEKEGTPYQKAALDQDFDQETNETSQEVIESKSKQLKYNYMQNNNIGRRPVMKANHIKWNPSMLNKFFIPEYNIKHLVKHTHTKKEEKLKQTSEFCKPCKKDAPDQDSDEAKSKTIQEIIEIENDIAQQEHNFLQYDHEDKETQQDVQPNGLPYIESNDLSNDSYAYGENLNPDDNDQLTVPDNLYDGNVIEVSDQNNKDSEKTLDDSIQDDISIKIKFRMPSKAMKTLEKLEILVNEDE